MIGTSEYQIPEGKSLTGFASSGNYIVELKVDFSVSNNLDRQGIVDKNHAIFTCRQALVVSIKNKDYPQYTLSSIKSSLLRWNNEKEKVNFEVNQFIYDLNYNGGYRGIWFYLTKEAAWMYGKDDFLPSNFTGTLYSWYSDGTLSTSTPYENGKKNGLYTEYYSNGKPHYKYEYENDYQHGLVTTYNEYGQAFRGF
jgi:hypothetical protein